MALPASVTAFKRVSPIFTRPSAIPAKMSCPTSAQSTSSNCSAMDSPSFTRALRISGIAFTIPAISSPISSIPFCRISGPCSKRYRPNFPIISPALVPSSGKDCVMPVSSLFISSFPLSRIVGIEAIIAFATLKMTSPAFDTRSGKADIIPLTTFEIISIPLSSTSGSLAFIPARKSSRVFPSPNIDLLIDSIPPFMAFKMSEPTFFQSTFFTASTKAPKMAIAPCTNNAALCARPCTNCTINSTPACIILLPSDCMPLMISPKSS